MNPERIARLRANLPNESGEYKVVQVTIDNTLHMGFSPTERWPRRSHASILEHLLEENGYCTRYEDGRLFFRSKDEFIEGGEQRRIYELIEDLSATDPALWYTKVPALSGEGYKVHGMGKVDIDVPNKTAKFFGTSLSYGIGLNEDLIKLLEEQESGWIWRKNER